MCFRWILISRASSPCPPYTHGHPSWDATNMDPKMYVRNRHGFPAGVYFVFLWCDSGAEDWQLVRLKVRPEQRVLMNLVGVAAPPHPQQKKLQERSHITESEQTCDTLTRVKVGRCGSETPEQSKTQPSVRCHSTFPGRLAARPAGFPQRVGGGTSTWEPVAPALLSLRGSLHSHRGKREC